MRRYKEFNRVDSVLIEEIPRNWRLSKFKYQTNIYNGDSLNSELKATFESDNTDERPYLGSKDINVNFGTVNYNNGIRIPKSESKYKVAPIGSTLICIEGGSAGRKIAYLEEEVCFVNKLACIDGGSKFYYYVVKSNLFKLQFFNSMSGLIGGVSLSQLKEFFFPLPPLPEQEKIVAFLDYKTERIDKLLKIKEEKIELLKQKRTALINEAVTKGINPNAKLKDSGIEWIGEIPEHWEIKKLKHLGNFQNGISKGAEYFGKGSPFMNYGDVYKNETTPLKVANLVETDATEKERYSVRLGDVFFTRTSETIDDIGISSTCMNTIEDCVFSGFLIRFRFYKSQLIPNYSKFHFQAEWKDTFIESRMNIVTRSSLSQTVLGQVPVIVPPIADQNIIIYYLEERTQEIDALIKLEEQKIKSLKEYRQALISEAVTGKIDVRDWKEN